MTYDSKRKAIVPHIVEVIWGVSFGYPTNTILRSCLVQLHNVGLKLPFLWGHNTCEHFLIEILVYFVCLKWNKVSKSWNYYIFLKMSDFIYFPCKRLSLCRKKGRCQNESTVTLMSRIVIINSKITECYGNRWAGVHVSNFLPSQEFCRINLQSVANQSNCFHTWTSFSTLDSKCPRLISDPSVWLDADWMSP